VERTQIYLTQRQRKEPAAIEKIAGKAVAFVESHAARIILSSIVVAELFAGVKGDLEQSTLDSFFSLFRIVPVSAEITKIGGLY
jgi:predicted nucleic acid-binding protein